MTTKLSIQNKSFKKNVDYYNSRDIDNSMCCFIDGIDQCRKFYHALFDESPRLHSNILSRIVFDNKVIDHESLVGRKGLNEPLEIVVIYEVKDSKNFKLTAIKKQ